MPAKRPFRRLVVVLLKQPIEGHVKTRLAKDIGVSMATHLYSLFVNHCFQTLGRCKGVDTTVYLSHPGKAEAIQKQFSFLGPIHYQSNGDLGVRMANAIFEQFKLKYDEILLVGTDCIQLSPSLIESAFGALKSHDMVLGPTHDGGYYLIGLRRKPNADELLRSVFTGVEWSTSRTLEQTVSGANRAHLSHKLLTKLSDIDELKDIGLKELSVLL
ncbi:MAG: rSAM/selenodomain-associated transferase 1 [Candidatus Omnitrophota bacterium]|jgi:rSAM/selenodomain-associated transferase 1